jgi:hypothetical protein
MVSFSEVRASHVREEGIGQLTFQTYAARAHHYQAARLSSNGTYNLRSCHGIDVIGHQFLEL